MVSGFPDITAALDLVVSQLRDVDVEASADTASVNVPGAWVAFVGFSDDVMSGERYVDVEVSVVVGAMPLTDAYRALVDLADDVVECLGEPDGPVRKQATLFGHDPVALPTLVLPYKVALTQEGNPVS